MGNFLSCAKTSLRSDIPHTDDACAVESSNLKRKGRSELDSALTQCWTPRVERPRCAMTRDQGRPSYAGEGRTATALAVLRCKPPSQGRCYITSVRPGTPFRTTRLGQPVSRSCSEILALSREALARTLPAILKFHHYSQAQKQPRAPATHPPRVPTPSTTSCARGCV